MSRLGLFLLYHQITSSDITVVEPAEYFKIGRGMQLSQILCGYE